MRSSETESVPSKPAVHAKYMREKYRLDPEFRDAARRRSAVARERAIARYRRVTAEAKAGGCARCPECDPVALDFHHQNGEKDLNVAELMKHSEKRLRAEIAKCVVLCANCHRKLHAVSRDR